MLIYLNKIWCNEVLDGCSKNPVVLKTNKWGITSCDLVNLITQILTHRYSGAVTCWNSIGFLWMFALIILWSQVQVLVGPPEKQTLTRNGGGFVFRLAWFSSVIAESYIVTPPPIFFIPFVLKVRIWWSLLWFFMNRRVLFLLFFEFTRAILRST